MLIKLGYDSNILNHLKYDEFGKPYIDTKTYFNISHSGDYVICAVSKCSKVGIDIEEVKPINIDDIKSEVFNEIEISHFKVSKNPIEFFYKIWTIKEAVLKGEGVGLQKSMNQIKIHGTQASFLGNYWNLGELRIDDRYAANIAFKGYADVSLNRITVLSASI